VFPYLPTAFDVWRMFFQLRDVIRVKIADQYQRSISGRMLMRRTLAIMRPGGTNIEPISMKFAGFRS